MVLLDTQTGRAKNLMNHRIRGRVVEVKYSRKVRLSSVKHLHCMYRSCNVSCLFKCLFPHSFFPSPLSQCASYRLTKFFVGNVLRIASPKDLMKYFARFGPVTNFHTPATGRHRGFGFVKFKNGFDPLCLLSTPSCLWWVLPGSQRGEDQNRMCE